MSFTNSKTKSAFREIFGRFLNFTKKSFFITKQIISLLQETLKQISSWKLF